MIFITSKKSKTAPMLTHEPVWAYGGIGGKATCIRNFGRKRILLSHLHFIPLPKDQEYILPTGLATG